MAKKYTIEYKGEFVQTVDAESDRSAWQIGVSFVNRNGWDINELEVTATPELRSFKDSFAIKKAKRDAKLTKSFWDWFKLR